MIDMRKKFYIFSFLLFSCGFTNAIDHSAKSETNSTIPYMKLFYHFTKGLPYDTKNGKKIVFEDLYVAGGFATCYQKDSFALEYESLFNSGNKLKVGRYRPI